MVRQAWALHGIARVPFDRTAVADGDDLPPMAPSTVPARVPSQTAPEQAEPEPTALDVSAPVSVPESPKREPWKERNAWRRITTWKYTDSSTGSGTWRKVSL
jgi:hypothetical protein